MDAGCQNFISDTLVHSENPASRLLLFCNIAVSLMMWKRKDWALEKVQNLFRNFTLDSDPSNFSEQKGS